MLTETDALGHVTSYEYDAKGNLTKKTDPMGNITTHAYDWRGNRTATTDCFGTTTYEYNASGYKTKETDALGNVTTYTYDSNGNELTMTKTRTGRYRTGHDDNDKGVRRHRPADQTDRSGWQCNNDGIQQAGEKICIRGQARQPNHVRIRRGRESHKDDAIPTENLRSTATTGTGIGQATRIVPERLRRSNMIR